MLAGQSRAAAVHDLHELLYEEALAAAAAGEIGQARALLAEVLRVEPRHAGAWLDLSLLACAGGDAETARRNFRELAERFDIPVAVRALIAAQLALPCREVPRPRWSAGLALGYDSNVNSGTRASHLVLGGGAEAISLPLAPELRPRGDSYSELWGEAALPASGFSYADPTIRLGWLTRRHARETAYDLQGVALSAEWASGSAPWNGTARLSWMTSNLGDSRYLDTLTAAWSGATPWATAGLPLRYALVASLAHYVPNPAFNALTLTGRLGIAGLWRSRRDRGEWPEWHWQAGVLLVADAGRDNRPGGDRLGGGFEAQAGVRLTPQTRLVLQGRFQRMNSREAYFAPLLPQRRSQQLWSARIDLATELGTHGGTHWLWVTSWNSNESRDSLPFLSYRSSVVQTALTVAF